MNGEQTIFRAHRTERDRWTNVLNDTVRDGRLSFRATGLLIYLLSLPPNWRANQSQITTCKTEGRDAVITAWNELRDIGYISKEIVRDKGKIVATVWNIFETPCSRPTEKPETAQPETVEPKTGNPTVRKTDFRETPKEERSPLATGEGESSIQSKVIEVHLPPELDSDEFVVAWDRWTANRRAMKLKPYTMQGAQGQLKRIAEWGMTRAIAAIDYSITQQHQGIYEEKNSAQANSNGASRRNAGTFNAGGSAKFAGVEKLA